MDENLTDQQPTIGDNIPPENSDVTENSALTLFKYCHDVDCDFYNQPQPYSRTLCFECGAQLFTTPA